MGNYAYTGIQVHRCVSRARCQSKKVKWIIELSKLLCALCAERRLKRTKVPQISIEKKCAEHFFFFEFKQTIAQYFPTNQRMRVGLMTTSTSSYQNCKKKSLLVQARDTKQMPIKTHKLVIFLTRQSTVDIK
jgi:hypothetical protein